DGRDLRGGAGRGLAAAAGSLRLRRTPTCHERQNRDEPPYANHVSCHDAPSIGSPAVAFAEDYTKTGVTVYGEILPLFDPSCVRGRLNLATARLHAKVGMHDPIIGQYLA